MNTVGQNGKSKGKAWWILMGSLIILHTIIINCFAESAKEEYELQEKCGKNAAAFFKRNYAKEGVITFYNNHYNRKLNKCFILVTSTTLPKKKGGHYITSKVLYDANENKEYGCFIFEASTHQILDCTVLHNPVSSRAEWEAIVKKYVEE